MKKLREAARATLDMEEVVEPVARSVEERRARALILLTELVELLIN